MPRANRIFVPHLVWHITHRCHKQEFLFKFQRDRQRWRFWLYQARRRYGLKVLNYVVTSNHAHLLVVDDGHGSIARSMQLIAGRTAQEYNRRKQRSGAFWEDRYHATAVEANDHLVRCLVYIDLNMVRAGVVRHPRDWLVCGYHEIQSPPPRYAIVDRELLAAVTGIGTVERLATQYEEWVLDALARSAPGRQPQWSESIAVGSTHFVAQVQAKLGMAARYRKIEPGTGGWELRDGDALYRPF